jgi:hypothetical protein
MSKQKALFHTFDLGERQVTLCVKRISDYKSGHIEGVSASEVAVGYSVKVKDDTFNQELAERISSGRADSDKARLASDIVGVGYLTNRVFQAIADVWERRITNNPSKFIKGIKVEQPKKKVTE